MNSLCYVFCLAAGLLAFASNASAQRVSGVPGVDYPNYTKIPKTSFKCSDQKHVPGFYADTETDCQVFHFCYKRRSESFLCPTGTIFNQAILACDSWFNSNCSLATMYYIVNASPGMRNAGKNIPMLRKLRDRVKSSTVQTEPPTSSTSTTTTTTTTTTTMAPETEPPVEQFEHFPAEDFDHDSEVDYSRDEEAVSSHESDFEHQNQFDSDQVVEEQAQDFEEEASTFYPVTEDARLRPFDADREGPVSHPEPVWRNPAAEEFQNEYNAQQMSEAAQRAQLLQQMIAASTTTLPPFFQEKVTQPTAASVEQFSKRSGQVFSAAVARRNRRRPTYVAADERSAFQHAVVYEPTTEVPVTTEEPIAEEISMDTLVELNTQLPVDYVVVKDENVYDEAQEVEDAEPQEPYQDFSPEMDDVEAGYDDQDSYDAVGQEGNEEYVTEGYTTEYLEPSDEFTTEHYAEQSAEVEPEEQMQDEVYEDIVVYDDSNTLHPPRMAPVNVPRAGPKEKVIIIPDETDFPSTETPVSEATVRDSVDGDAEDREDIYIVDDSVEGRPGYRYQVLQDRGNQQFYDPRAPAGFRQYGGPRAVPGRYGFQAPPRGMNYGRMQGPAYNYPQYQRYPPNYYEYVDEYGRPLNPEHVDPTIQHMPEDPDQVDEPDGMYDHGVYGDSYEGAEGEGQPEEDEGQYVYNPETGYYHTPDGRVYTSEGVEVQSPVVAGSSGPVEQAAEDLQQQEQFADQPFSEGQFAPVPDGTAAVDSKESDAAIAGSMAASSVSLEALQEDMDEEDTQSGLMTESEGQPKDGFIHLDEEGEAGASDEEFHDFDDSAFDEEPAEEVVAEDAASKDNETDSARAGERDHETPEEEIEKLPEPEVPAFQDDQQETGKSGEPALEPEPAWPPEQPAFPDSEPAPQSPPAEETPASEPFSSAGSSDFQNAAPQPLAEPFSSPFQQSPAVNPFAAAGMSGPGDFMAPSENQFMNMGFQSPMDFGPYGLGPNVRQQFGMKDSSSGRPSFSGGKRGRPSRNPLSSLKSVKQGKFGMFKKMMQNI